MDVFFEILFCLVCLYFVGFAVVVGTLKLWEKFFPRGW